MSRSQYPYPPDEFDVRGPDDSPVGVHRAPRSKWSSAWPFLLVAVIAVVVAVAGVTFLSRGTGTASDASGTTQSQPAGAGASASPKDPAAAASTPAADPTPAASPTAPAGTDIATLIKAANPAAKISVLNDTGPKGEAAKGQAALKAKGFTNATATNWTFGTAPQVTSVWYKAGKSDTAAAVAAILGIPAANVSQQTPPSGDVCVIIKTALTPAG